MDINCKHISIALALAIVISWTHCYNRIADLEQALAQAQLEVQQYDKH